MILYAVFLDLLLGDPNWIPHPVQAIGRLISSLESLLYPKRPERGRLLVRGILLVLLVTLISFSLVYLLLSMAWQIHFLLGQILTLYILTTSLAFQGLYSRGRAIKTYIDERDIHKAREVVGEMVGRDTNSLKEEEIIRATLESLAENISDGFIAPLFYMLIGGAPLALLYKAVNTLDSMVGYRDSRYLYFGRAAAYLDDMMNYIPARLTLLFLFMASLLLRLKALEGWRSACRDGPRHASPNAGYLEAFLAGVLGVQLGGPSLYQKKLRESPYLGDGERVLDTVILNQALQCIALASLIPVILITLYYLGGLW